MNFDLFDIFVVGLLVWIGYWLLVFKIRASWLNTW